ncbi:MAG: hypothetical protein WCU00_04330 [Candidatus Latescibacterota bacterium]
MYACIQFIFLLLAMLSYTRAWAIPYGDVVNTAYAAYETAGGYAFVQNSNSVTTHIEMPPKPVLEFLYYSPNNVNAQIVPVGATEYSPSGNINGPFVPIPTLKPVGKITSDSVDGVPLTKSNCYRAGDLIFLRLIDSNQNTDSTMVDKAVVTMSEGDIGEKEVLRISETGVNTGLFVGFIQTQQEVSVTPGDGILSVVSESKIDVGSTDMTGEQTVTSEVRITPLSTVFDTKTGQPVNDVVITLINAETGQPAEVFGDDGTSSFPSRLVTGSSVTDGSGVNYNFTTGSFRFPYIKPGNYQLKVETSALYTFPSKVSEAELKLLGTGSFTIVTGSLGKVFEVVDGPPFLVDVPIDPVVKEEPVIKASIWVMKSAGKLNVSPGEFLAYTISVTNNAAVSADSVMVTDNLPNIFRYQKGSAKTEDGKQIETTVGPEGDILTFSLGNIPSNKTIKFTYVVKAPSNAKPGRAINTALAVVAGGYKSNIAKAEVRIVDDLFRSTSILMGRVIADSSSFAPSDSVTSGIKGVRIYLEDGTYTVSDEKGMFHFEGVRPGVHTLQIDTDSLPEEYELVPSDPSKRKNGSVNSQFVDIQGGTLWQCDFHAVLKPRMKSAVHLSIKSALSDSTADYTVRMKGGAVPLSRMSLSVALPDSLSYIHKSSILNGEMVNDPEIMGGVLIYRLGDTNGDWTKEIKFRVSVPKTGAAGDLVTKGLLTFNTPLEKNKRTPVVENVLQEGAIQTKEGADSTLVEITGLRPGEKKKTVPVEEEKDAAAEFDSSWLASATPGFEILYPSQDYLPPIGSLKFAVKHDPKMIIFLFLDGKLVEPLNFEKTDKNESGTVAVRRWIGVDIQEGDNEFDVVAADSTGKEISRLERKIHYSGPPVHIELIKDKSILVADGKTIPVIALKMTDKDGYPCRSGVTGSFTLEKPYTTRQEVDKLRSSAINGSETGNHYIIGKNGIALIELQTTTRSGEAVLKFQFTGNKDEVRAWLKPEARDWVLVGLAESTFGYNTIKGNMENLNDSDIHDNYYDEGRVAFFAKGKVKGSWLMTLSYDTSKDVASKSDNLFGTIDPDKYYTLYGDATDQQYDSASTEKLYLKIERSQFYALFGAYQTGLDFTVLSKYSRSFNGLKSEVNTDHVSLNVFANETGQSFVKDEIRGDGTSGLYRLSRNSILVNSEKIVIETRDRFKSEVILSSKSMNRHLDYNIDYDACTVFFKEPVMSKDENLNPIYIVVDYETGKTTGDSYNYGGRGALKFMDRKVEVGSTYIHENDNGDTGDLIGTDATLKIGLDWEFKGEFARTSTDVSGAEKNGEAYIAELTRRSGKLDGKMYFREIDTNFGLGQQSTGEIGTRKVGLDTSYRFSQMFVVNEQMYRQYNLDNDGVRDMAEARLNYSGERYSTSLGFRHAEDRLSNTTANRSEQITLGGGIRMLNKKLQIRLTHDQTVGGNNASVDFPTRTTAGLDYDILKSATLFAEQEFTSGKNEDSRETRAGVKTRPWGGAQFDTSIERDYSENKDRLFANIGLRQSLYLSKKLSADIGLDRSQSLKHSGNTSFDSDVSSASGTKNNFTAVSLGTNYHEKTWSWTNRIETRYSQTDDKWGVISGIYGEPKEGLGLSGSAQIFRTDYKVGNKTNSGNIRIGLAHRPKNSQWIVLNRLDLIQESSLINKTDLLNRRIVNNLNTNYEFNTKTQLSFQYVSKYVLDTVNSEQYKGYMDIFGVEMRNCLTKRFDFGIRSSILHSWDSSQIDYSAGFSFGVNILDNIWLSAGYNFCGFQDSDYSRENFSAQGPYLQFRTKFDQNTIKGALNYFGKPRELSK